MERNIEGGRETVSLTVSHVSRKNCVLLLNINKIIFIRGPMVRCLKGYSNTAIGLSVGDIVSAILHNTQAVIPVSTLIKVHTNIRALLSFIGATRLTHITYARKKKDFCNRQITINSRATTTCATRYSCPYPARSARTASRRSYECA